MVESRLRWPVGVGAARVRILQSPTSRIVLLLGAVMLRWTIKTLSDVRL